MPIIDDPVRVGATVRALREAHGWALGKFAVAVGMTHGHLANIEAGRKNLTPEKITKVAAVLGIPRAAITTAYPVEEIA